MENSGCIVFEPNQPNEEEIAVTKMTKYSENESQTTDFV